ncbi:MAG: beta-propeller domain-containing protein [Maricaulaceae bacterium]|nr:beta-propeller domain-containing protein [Maricaulaceae bacterium]
MLTWTILRALRRAAAALAMTLAAAAAAAAVEDGEADGMPNFESDEALLAFLAPEGEERDSAAVYYSTAPATTSVPPPPPPPPAAIMERVTVTGTRAAAAGADESITNVQVEGVDEGGIVKVSGDHLVILRRGRLFTVSVADGGLRAVDSIDAFPPGADASGDWYDEMLISGDLIVVVGYSYRRGGTEINRFRISAAGGLSFVDSHHLRSDDYYSSRNYASRLIGEELIFYTPRYLRRWGDPLASLPGLSRWQPGRDGPQYQRIAAAQDVFIPAPLLAEGPRAVQATHTVTRCDLAAAELSCRATVVLGQEGHNFFVAQDAVYVWTGPGWRRRGQDSAPLLYRLPLDGGRPGAVQVQGGPVDQFSFNANDAAQRLEVLVTEDSRGAGMWAAEFARGRPALLRLPLARFGDGSRAAPDGDYRLLPGEAGARITHNRFIGGRVLYGQSPRFGGTGQHSLVAAPVDDGAAAVFELPGMLQRIEPLGRDALAVADGRDAALFLTVDLAARRPAIIDRYAERGARQAESRSHGFFYRPDADSAGGDAGLLGLPVVNSAVRGVESASMLFLRRNTRRLSDYGRLSSRARPGQNDRCVASCVDWYGNARPVFLRGRVFALLGYELVEGDASGAAIRETQRINFGPGAPPPKPGL